MRKKLVAAVIGIGSALAVGVVSAGALAAGPAGRAAACSSRVDPYRYAQTTLRACGYKTFPRSAVHRLPGGGFSYDYHVEGALIRRYVPPAGFNPAKATAAQLDEYGLPQRPSTPLELDHWRRDVSNWRGAAPPPPFLVESRVRADSVATANWAGYAVSGGSGAFTHAETWYLEPAFYGTVCSNNAEVTWSGIGGYNGAGDPMAQDGTSHNLWADHQAWTEIVPLQNVMPEPFYGHQGYEFDASVRWLGNGYRFYMYDYYSGQTDAFDEFPTNAAAYYSGDSVEAIGERPEANGQFTNLSNFGKVADGTGLRFLGTRANGIAINSWSPTGGRHGVHMTEDGSWNTFEMATPSGLGSGGAFGVSQNRCY